MTNLASLGDEQDRIDAAAIIRIFDATVCHPEAPAPSGKASDLGKIRRATFETIWEWPRRRVWRPLTVPWSAAAREIYDAEPKSATRNLRTGLVTERVVPVNVITSLLMQGEPTVDAYLAVLRAMCVVSVITKAEDLMLSAAGLANRPPSPPPD